MEATRNTREYETPMENKMEQYKEKHMEKFEKVKILQNSQEVDAYKHR